MHKNMFVFERSVALNILCRRYLNMFTLAFVLSNERHKKMLSKPYIINDVLNFKNKIINRGHNQTSIHLASSEKYGSRKKWTLRHKMWELYKSKCWVKF